MVNTQPRLEDRNDTSCVFDHAWATTKGARAYQEDLAALRALDDVVGTLIAVLADGMGGHAGGAQAAKIVCDTFRSGFGEASGPTPTRLSEAMHAANEALAQRVEREPMLSGMGSTLIGTAFDRRGLHWVSVGDSPLWLYRRGEIAQLNEDHSLAPELDRLAAAGHMSVEEARSDPRRHMLRSAVTGDEIDMVDLSPSPLKLEPGDFVLLASDGVQTLEPSEIERVVTGYARDGASAIATALIRDVENMREPHQDNATVVVVGIS